MTIKTLEYIHRLLLDEEARTAEQYDAARKLQYEYEESEAPDRALVKRQEAEADRLIKAHFAAASTLEDFEGREW